MRNNKAILDEAARSVRQTFIGSVAGSVVMLAVVGAAGAYGMPEKLTAQAFSAAMTKFNMKFAQKAEHAPVAAEPLVKMASNVTVAASSPVTDAPDDEAVVLVVPKSAACAGDRANRRSGIGARDARGYSATRRRRAADCGFDASGQARAGGSIRTGIQSIRQSRSRAGHDREHRAGRSAGRRRGTSAHFRADDLRSAEGRRCPGAARNCRRPKRS